jgi:hypothetical protein
MKIGKFISLGEHDEVKVGYGTVDFKNLKTIYLKLNAWVKPTDETLDFDKTIFKSRRLIKELIREADLSDYFKKESIVDLDIRTKGIKLDKKSFMNLEITLFVNKQFDIKQKDIKVLLQNLTKNIINVCLTDKTLYNFSKTKL